ncbi:hypothetical protein PHYBOEH_004956 [Phytophthora boehmeriae]|uniref:C2 NT-type domain-containing protein n=1 Tax=Phytophthora boehmeriae TaxID=109152 RepID=A0A8T1WQ14_9STRA|nr:hypothetical protein PHYBOEH_004956 [Phytophthora boehmeriae]
MRRGASHHDNMASRPTYKGAMPSGAGAGAATTPRSQRSTAAATTPRSQRSTSGGKAHGTILVDLDVHIHRANIGHDISPSDEDLIVLFRRNSKEVTSEPARWSAEHVAVWNQHVGIQTSLLRHKKGGASEFLKKEYEIVLVALPSHSAVALFSLDFASIVQLSANPQDRHKSFRISPLKCRDLAATLEFDITWDLVDASSPGAPSTSNMLLHPTSNTNPHAQLAGLPPSSTLLSKSHQTANTSTTKASRSQTRSRRGTNDASPSSSSTRRTATSMSSQGSERELMDELASSSCSSCRSAKRRLERKEVQVLQLESFLKESQKRIDALATENEELTIREKAETRNAAQQRALSLRLLQEIETAVQLCNSQMQNQSQASDMELLPQLELLERVKKYHEEVDPLHGHSESSQGSHNSQTSFDFRAETEAALQRNQRLQQQLEFLGRSMDYDSEDQVGSTRSHRAATDTSGTTISSVRSGSVTVDCEARPVALTMTQQLNNLERENFKLKTQLEDALNNAANSLKKHSGGYPSGLSLTAEVSETTSCSSREELEEPEHEDAALLSRIREQHEMEAGRSAALESKLEKAQEEIETLKEQLEATQNESAAPKEPQQAPGFLDKIYADVGKAKLVLEERVKQLNDTLADATEENARLRSEIEELQKRKSNGNNEATAAETEAHIAELEKLLESREQELKSNESALAATKRQLEAAETRVRSGESAKAELENELAGVRLTLKLAQEETAQLESQLTMMSANANPAPTTSASFVSHHSVASDATAHTEELAEVQKQLKLSKQEVMQLRFRSNQLESVNERLEEVLKEKRTLEVKLTALEGQLFEQRNRTITDNSSFTAPSLDAKSSALLTDMQRDLDQKSAQLLIAERELEHLRSEVNGGQGGQGGTPGKIEDMADKVTRFENEIAQLCQRNDEQARRLEKLGARVTVAVRERDELETIVQQMVTEMALLGKPVDLTGSRSHRTPSIPETNEMEEKLPSSLPRRVSPPAPVQTGKITDRYANAVASSSSHSPGASTPGVTNSKVAQLMKNFSAAGSDGSSPSVSPSGVAFKRPTKLDFRNRKASTTSQSSNGTTPTSRLREAPSPKFI